MVGALIPLLATYSAATLHSAELDAQITAEMGSVTYSALKKGHRGFAIRLDYKPGADPDQLGVRINLRQSLEGRVTRPANDGSIWIEDDTIDRLRTLLLNDKSYAWGKQRQCPGHKTVLFRVYEGDHNNNGAFTATANVCAACDQVNLNYRPTGEGRWIAFDPVRRQMHALLKRLLPDDEAIKQAIRRSA